jgi:membrane-bound ClpP family serine protease
MIDPTTLGIMLLACGVVLLVGELLLPTHGILGIVGLLCFGGALGVVFYLNKWLGLALFFAAIVASPFLFSIMMKLWVRTPVGRRIILQPQQTLIRPAAVNIGQVGTTTSELRPIGECEFGEMRLEVVSELGMIAPGTRVRVIAISNGRPMVRIATEI